MMEKQNQHSYKKARWLMAYICMPLIFVCACILLWAWGLRPVILQFEMKLNTLFNGGSSYYAEAVSAVLGDLPDNDLPTAKPDQPDPDTKKEVVEEPDIGDEYGYMTCERLGISAPVYFGDNPEVLLHGVGTYPVSWIPGCGSTTLISGHNDMHLKNLADVRINDEFVLNTDYGEYTYRVSEITIVDESDIKACRLGADEEQVVLYTCYPFYKISGRRTERFFVYLEKISGPQIELTNYFMKDLIPEQAD